jgi:GMP synthase (glutamine-hydrolysing)
MTQGKQSSVGPDSPQGGVLIIDFGAQYCQLIARRVRELGVYSRITVPERAMFTFAAMRPGAVILSGGPRSVYEHDAPALDPAILQQGVPVLGICYGLQWIAQHTGGEVTPAQSGAEYGRTALEVVDPQGFRRAGSTACSSSPRSVTPRTASACSRTSCSGSRAARAAGTRGTSSSARSPR